MTKTRIREIRDASAKNSAHKAIIAELLAEIEAFQKWTRRGETPPAPEELPPAATLKLEKDPRVKLFIDGWYDAFKEFHKETYLVTGGKDAAAAKRLLSLFPGDESAVGTFLDTAWAAWFHPDKFNCKQAVTIAGFASRYNDIKAELREIANGTRPKTQGPAKCTL